MPKAADQATNNGTPPNSTACLRPTPLIDLASVANTFQPSVEVPKSLDLIDGTLPWIATGECTVSYPIVSGLHSWQQPRHHRSREQVHKVILRMQFDRWRLVLDHTRMSAKKLRLELL